MALSDTEKLELRAAIGVARGTNPPRDLDDALRILNGQVIDGDYWTSLIGVDAINDAKARCNTVFPGAYDVIWERFKEELRLAPPIGGGVSPEPVPSPISYPTPIPATPAGDFSEAVFAAFASRGIFIEQNKLSIGKPVDLETQACLQLGGVGVAAEIQGESNFGGTDKQNPNERHVNTFVVCDNDGGMRGRQYMKWFNGKVRNTTNRPGSIFALFDSYGDTCISDDRWARGQFWYLVKGLTRGFLSIYQSGVKLEIRETSAEYSASDVQKL